MISTNYTADMIQPEESPPKPKEVTPTLVAVNPRRSRAEPISRRTPRRSPRPRTVQHVITPPRLGHSIVIDKTGMLDTEIATPTRRTGVGPLSAWSTEETSWRGLTPIASHGDRPRSSEVAARSRHRIMPTSRQRTRRLEGLATWTSGFWPLGASEEGEEAALLEAIATPKAAQNSQPELPEEVGFSSPAGPSDEPNCSSDMPDPTNEEAAEKPLTPEKKSADKDEASVRKAKSADIKLAGLQTRAKAKLAATLDRLSAPDNKDRRPGAGAARGAAQARADAPTELEKLQMQTIRRVVSGDSYADYAGESRLPADRQSTVMDEMSGETRPLTNWEQRSILAVFREMAKSSAGVTPAERAGEKSERKDGREGGGKAETADDAVRASSGAMISWAEVAKSLRGKLSSAHIQRLGVYFGLKGLKGKIRFKLYEERVALLVTASPEKRNRIAFGLLDVGGDGVVGRRDVFAALASARSEDTAYNESLDAVFTSPGSYGIHFADSDTPSLLVVGVVPASPAENQGVRVGHRLSRINGISVDKLTTQEVRTLLMNPSRPLSMTFRYRPAPDASDNLHRVPNGIFDLRDLKRLLEALATDHVTRRVKIFVEKAKNLKAVEQHLLNSHPYCQVEVEGKPQTRWQTKVCEQMNPEWNEEREIADFAIGETLRFTVRDKDFGTKEDDILGIATLPSARFTQDKRGFEDDLILYEENMQRKTNSTLHVRVNLGGEGGIAISDFEKVFHDGEPLFLRQLQEVLTGVAQKRKDYATESVKLVIKIISATGLRSAEPPPVKADSYCTCEIAGSKKSQNQRPWQTKTVTDSLDPVWNETKKDFDYIPGEALRFAIHDSDQRSSQVDELLGSYEMPSSQFWPGGFDGEVTLTQEEHSRRDKKSTVTLKLKVTTPESAAPHQFASAVKPAEPGSNPGAAAALERFEAEMKELRARLPFLKEADFSWHMHVFEALRDEDWLIQRARLVVSAHKIFGIPVGDIAGRLFEAVSPKGSPVGILEWAQFLERYRNGDWYSLQERIHLTFALYDLDGDGMLSLADAISLSREVERLELIYGKESSAMPVCEEMRWLYGLIANAADGGHDGGRLDLQVFKQLRPNPSLTQVMLSCMDAMAQQQTLAPRRPRPGPLDTTPTQ